jgi:RecA/RadA recombinase
MKFLSDFEKSLADETDITDTSAPPRYWYSSGNYTVNRQMSGRFDQCYPQGRITGISGASGTGKSYLVTNAMKDAEKHDDWTLVIDSENALDDNFVRKIGVDPTREKYIYKSVTTISHVTKVVSSFIKGYTAEYGTDSAAPRVLIVIDSLDMLSTDTEIEHFAKGDQSSDQGLRAKQLKLMLRQFVQSIKNKNITMIVTGQVYQATAQQIMEGEGKWIINQAVRYALSHIMLLTKLKLKDEKTKAVEGVRIKVEAFKTRFTKPFQTTTVEVPYETGIDPLSGLLEVALSTGIVVKKGSRYSLVNDDKTWYSSAIGDYAEQIMSTIDAENIAILVSDEIAGEEEAVSKSDTAKGTKQKRMAAVQDSDN